MIEDLCAYFYALPVFFATIMLLIFSLTITINDSKYMDVPSYVISIFEPTSNPLSSTAPPLKTYNYTILYQYQQIQYQKQFESYAKYSMGEKVPIKINKNDPTDVSFNDLKAWIIFLWVITSFLGIISILFIFLIQTPEGRRDICWGNILFRFFSSGRGTKT